MKYVMLENDKGGFHPVLFHESLIHSVVAHGICREYRREGEWINPVSAGFYDEEKGVTSGFSESLSLKSDPTDSFYIKYGDAVRMVPRKMVPVMQKDLEKLQ